VTVPCCGKAPIGTHPPVQRQRAPAQARADRSSQRHHGQSYRGSDPTRDGTPTSSQSYRDVEELLAERGVEVDHVTVYRWVQRFTPLLAEAARPCRHAVGDRWWVDETYVKVGGQWGYACRAIDQFGQVIDVFVSPGRDVAAARRFFERAIGTTKVTPVEVVTDRAPTYPVVLEELLPAAWHRTDQYANNRVECDHDRLWWPLRPMRGLKQDRSAKVIIAGMPSFRTFDAATTSWLSRSRRLGGWPSRSTNWPWPSGAARRSQLQHVLGQLNATVPALSSWSRDAERALARMPPAGRMGPAGHHLASVSHQQIRAHRLGGRCRHCMVRRQADLTAATLIGDD
jgi:IS6 family transposase